MTVPPPGRQSAARGRKQEQRQERPPGETRRRQQMLRSISTRVSQGHRRARRRNRERYRPEPATNDARVRANKRGQGATRPALDDRSDLDARAPALVHEEQKPTRPTAARGRNVRWRTAERHASRQNATQPGGRVHAAARQSDQKNPMAPPTRERSEKNEASTVAAEPGAATPTARERVVITAENGRSEPPVRSAPSTRYRGA